MGADKIIAGAAAVATATVSLFPNGMIDAEARVETPHKKELKEMVSILNISWSNDFFEIRKWKKNLVKSFGRQFWLGPEWYQLGSKWAWVTF